VGKKTSKKTGNTFQHQEISKNNKKLSDDNTRLTAKQKALEAELESIKIQCISKDEEIASLRNEPVYVESTSDQGLSRVFDKLMEVDINSTLNKQDLANTALKYQTDYNNEQLRYLKEEQDILKQSPEVVTGTVEQAHRITQRNILLGFGIVFLFIGVCLISASVWMGFQAAIAGGGITSLGLIVTLMSYVPNISAEDTEKLSKLSKAFGLNQNSGNVTPSDKPNKVDEFLE